MVTHTLGKVMLLKVGLLTPLLSLMILSGAMMGMASAQGYQTPSYTTTVRPAGQAITVPPVANRNNLPGKSTNNVPNSQDVFGLTETQRLAVEQDCRSEVGKQFPKLQANQPVLGSICQCATNKIAQADAKLTQNDYTRFLNKDPSLLNDPRYAQVIMEVSEACINPIFQKDPSVFLDMGTPDGRMPTGQTYNFGGTEAAGAANGTIPPALLGAMPGTNSGVQPQPAPNTTAPANNTRRPFVVR